MFKTLYSPTKTTTRDREGFRERGEGDLGELERGIGLWEEWGVLRLGMVSGDFWDNPVSL